MLGAGCWVLGAVMLAFLSPLFLLGMAAAAVPIVLHLLKREPEARLKFSAVKLLRRAPVEHTRRRHLNELLLLLLRVAALTLLALAFARPFFASGTASASSGLTVVALDTSLSLSAPGQFDKARELARDAVGAAPSGGLVAVVTFADAAQVAARPTTDRALARAAIDAATPGLGATRYRPALNAAADLVDGQPGTIVVVTDMQASGWGRDERASVPEPVRVQVRDVGAAPPNVAVTSVRASEEKVVAVIRNTGPTRRDVRVWMTLDGVRAGEGSATVGPDGSAEVSLPGGRGRELSVSVDDPGGIQADNTRHVIVDGSGRPAILVVTASGDLEREGLYLRHAITAAGREGAAFDVEGVGGSQLASWDRERLAAHPVVALLSTRGVDRAGRELLLEYVRSGHGLLLAAGPNVDGEVAAGALGGALTIGSLSGGGRGAARSFAPTDVRHPIFQPFGGGATLGLVKFRRTAAMAGDGCHALARFTGGDPAVLECGVGAGRVIAVASDLDNAWNDFPVHATFVPFVHETLRYLAGPRADAGELLIADVPAGVPPRAGVALVGGRSVAINVDPVEVEPRRLTVEEFEAGIARTVARAGGARELAAQEQEERQHVWQYLLGLMVAVLALESYVGARTS